MMFWFSSVGLGCLVIGSILIPGVIINAYILRNDKNPEGSIILFPFLSLVLLLFLIGAFGPIIGILIIGTVVLYVVSKFIPVRRRLQYTSNRAFEEYRTETLRQLNEDRRDFAKFLDELRYTEDKAQFDAFLLRQQKHNHIKST